MQALKALAICAMPIALSSIALSCIFAYVQAREYSYTTSDWQRYVMSHVDPYIYDFMIYT